jgi:hypothetical protein
MRSLHDFATCEMQATRIGDAGATNIGRRPPWWLGAFTLFDLKFDPTASEWISSSALIRVAYAINSVSSGHFMLAKDR